MWGSLRLAPIMWGSLRLAPISIPNVRACGQSCDTSHPICIGSMQIPVEHTKTVQESPSLVPRPHPLRGKRGLVNLDRFLGLAGSVCARRLCCTETNLGSDWSVMLLGRGPTIQIYIAGNGALHSRGWRVIRLR